MKTFNRKQVLGTMFLISLVGFGALACKAVGAGAAAADPVGTTVMEKVTWSELSATAPGTSRNATLTFTFDKDVEDFSVSFDKAVTGGTPRRLDGTGVYELDVSDVPDVETINVSVAKSGVTFDPASRPWDVENGTSETTAPGPVTDFVGVAGIASVILNWTDPPDAGLAKVNITFTPPKDGVTQPIVVNSGSEALTVKQDGLSVSGLENGAAYTFTAVTENTGGQKGTPVSAGPYTPYAPDPADTTAPAPVTGLTGTPGDHSVTLSWTNPADADLHHIHITWTPPGSNGGTGYDIIPPEYAKQINGLNAGVEYTFTVRAVDTNENASEAGTVSATPVDLTPPAEISGLTWESGFDDVTLSWTGNPADADFTGIEITRSGDAAVHTVAPGAAKTDIWTGLANGTGYTFTVKTADASGNRSDGLTTTATTGYPSVITFQNSAGETLPGSPFTIKTGTVIPANKVPSPVIFDDEAMYGSNAWDLTWRIPDGAAFALSTPVSEASLTLVPNRVGPTYTITFDAATAGGTCATASISGHYPNTVALTDTGALTGLPQASKDGATFVSWTLNSNGTGNVLRLDDLWTGNKTYYAKFETNPHDVTLSFTTGGMGTPSAATVVVNSAIPVLAGQIPTVSGASYTLEAWNSAEDGTGDNLQAGDIITEDTAYYALWAFPEDGANWAVGNPAAPWEGGSGNFNVPRTGYYKVQLWGGQGGVAGTGAPTVYRNEVYTMNNAYNSTYGATGDSLTVNNRGDSLNGIMPGGRGAYTSGHILFHKGDVIVLKIGGSRVDNHDPGGGYNGGGSGYPNAYNDGAGGGATDIRIAHSLDGTVTELVPLSGSAIDTDVGLINRIMVAAGGGGSADSKYSGAGSSGTYWLHKGGAGGGVLGNYGHGDDPGKPASQIVGGAAPGAGGSGGSFGKGGSVVSGASESYGGGGGGWFGGGSGGYGLENGSGAGGSSYVSGFTGDALNHGLPCIGTQKTAGGTFLANTAGDALAKSKSWTGYFFTHIQILDGYQQVPNTSGGGTEQGHYGAGSAKITWVGATDASVEGD